MATDQIADLISEELRLPVGPAASAMAEYCRSRHEQAAIAVLFYGSCLRQPDQALKDALLDFYVIVDNYVGAYGSALLAAANAALPPNVFYVEIPWDGGHLRAKYAVMSLDQFTSACGRAADNVSIWARFSQPARLVWRRSPEVEVALTNALAEACRTMFENARPLVEGHGMPDPVAVWQEGFKATYGAELRSEKSDRALAIVSVDEERYRRIGTMLMDNEPYARVSRADALRQWRRRGRLGKRLNYMRLIKAAFTFDGAVDYVMWKVRRHSGVVIEVSEWQRRHPLLAAPGLAWKLYRLGAFR
ncbi:hypothetical protein [Dongia sp.]|uniref:hypothetical protein n=1 Tax=Dongia sp. TaxID=1977262 RepID=UPI0035ADC004